MNLSTLLQAQVSLCRTQNAVPINMRIMERLIMATENHGLRFLKCQGCGLVLTENDFPNGCPNCQEKKVEFLPDSVTSV